VERPNTRTTGFSSCPPLCRFARVTAKAAPFKIGPIQSGHRYDPPAQAASAPAAYRSISSRIRKRPSKTTLARFLAWIPETAASVLLIGLPYWNLDLSVKKSIRVAESISVELQSVFANVLNHSQPRIRKEWLSTRAGALTISWARRRRHRSAATVGSRLALASASNLNGKALFSAFP
jgi:hypothetical protein